VRDAELTPLEKLGKTKGCPPPFGPQEAPRGPRLHYNAFPRVAGRRTRACRLFRLFVFPRVETARVDDMKVRALLTERGRGQIKDDKCAMPFVQLFKVRSRKQRRPLSMCAFCLF